MTLLACQIFSTIAHEGSFARTAEQLHLTPSAISHAVSTMEAECGRVRRLRRGRAGDDGAFRRQAARHERAHAPRVRARGRFGRGVRGTAAWATSRAQMLAARCARRRPVRGGF